MNSHKDYMTKILLNWILDLFLKTFYRLFDKEYRLLFPSLLLLLFYYHRLLGIPKDDKIVYNNFFGKLKNLILPRIPSTNLAFKVKILSFSCKLVSKLLTGKNQAMMFVTAPL